MRRWIAILMIAGLLFLCGCAREGETLQPALKFRKSLLEAGACSYVADVTADYGDYVYEFTLDCEFDGDKGSIKVLAPECVAGVTADFSGTDCTAAFDGAVLDFGTLADGRVAPLSVPWLLGTAWERDYISLCSRENECDRITILKGYQEEELTVDTWLQDGVPAFAEILYQGRSVLRLKIRNFALG